MADEQRRPRFVTRVNTFGRRAVGRVRRTRVARRAQYTAWRLSAGRLGRAFYGHDYFDGSSERDPHASGYGSYTRESSNADLAAYLLWRFVPFTTSLDVGCARGYVVEALLELGYDPYGWDISEWAIRSAGPEVRDRLAVVDLRRPLPPEFGGRSYSLITALEVFEHLPPKAVPSVLRRMRTLSDGIVVATIPSIGPNPFGPDGFPEGKVRPERLEWYQQNAASFAGPVPARDLALDRFGMPIEGHLTISSYEWWTKQFADAGFYRLGTLERAMHPVMGRFELSVAWSLYVFSTSPDPPAPVVRSDAELAELERRWGLAERPVGGHSRNLTRATVGADAVDAIDQEYERSQARAAAFAPASDSPPSGN